MTTSNARSAATVRTTHSTPGRIAPCPQHLTLAAYQARACGQRTLDPAIAARAADALCVCSRPTQH